MKGSLVILLFFASGVLCGRMGWIDLPQGGADWSKWILWALLLCVGISVGANSEFRYSIRRFDRRLLLLPVCTIGGTLLGTTVIWAAVSNYSLTDCLAVASGFGYYSLSSIIISNERGAELGAVALLANIIRELITLLGAPLLVCVFGKSAPIVAGGATTMDTTLPIIVRYSGKEFIVIALIHGSLIDLAVQLLVPLFCSLGK